MAELSRKKKPFIRLELSFSGFLGLGVVIFCVFFWMFLLGIWSGQTVLQPESTASDKSLSLSPKKMITSWWSGARTAMNGVLRPKPKPLDVDNNGGVDPLPAEKHVAPPEKEVKPHEKESAPGPLLFTLQVSSYKSESEAMDAVLAWRASGYEAYLGLPELEEGEGSWRVLVGKYTRLNDANAAAGKFEEQENTRAFIAQVAESKFRVP